MIIQNDEWLKGYEQAKQDFLKILDDLDIDLFLEDVADVKTGNKIELPKEVWDLWTIYWEHIKEKLKAKLKKGESGE